MGIVEKLSGLRICIDTAHLYISLKKTSNNWPVATVF